MKRLYLFLIAILLVTAGIYVWGHRADYAALRRWLPASLSGTPANSTLTKLDWRPVEGTALGFRVDMPGAPSRITVQAENETGSTDPVSMLLAEPASNLTYAVAWAEKPPVVRASSLAPDETLDQARDGALARTGTTLDTETRTTQQGFPGRDIVAHNAEGGILDTRLIYAAPHLYMLIAASPSAESHNEADVMRFFNSFTIRSNTQPPESLPAGNQ